MSVRAGIGCDRFELTDRLGMVMRFGLASRKAVTELFASAHIDDLIHAE
ncbi:MAG: hypothetical protein M0038_08515 [Pseudomonadota bacterium]|nr:hypothetical protein [Pseudomonadota bacterium]